VRLHFSAISDVGRVRKDNQDSGYVGPHLVVVCDGVGGAARGDIASSTAIAQLRKLDEVPPDPALPEADLLGLVSGAMHRAHNRIAELVDEQPALNGTSTTATLALFDGVRLAMGHVGDSRAYLFRGGEISQLTTDHTFVQSLIDEGRINEQEARVHPHRNLILKAIDGIHDLEPDLFVVPMQVGDRLLVCSDGACGVLDAGRLADILSSGSADYAAVELVRASLEAGSSDNVTCLVADVVDGEIDEVSEPPLLVGAAAEMRRRGRRGQSNLFRGHRAGDTGELEPVAAELPEEVGFAISSDPIPRSTTPGAATPPTARAAGALDPEAARYAPRPPTRYTWLTRLLVLTVLLGLVWIGLAGLWSWSQQQYFVGEQDGRVVIFRGIDQSLPGFDLSTPYETTNVTVDRLSDFDAGKVHEGIGVGSLDDARQTVDNLAAKMAPVTTSGDSTATPSTSPTTSPTSSPTSQPASPSTPTASSTTGGP
jgi:PPM family protein phosphatase